MSNEVSTVALGCDAVAAVGDDASLMTDDDGDALLYGSPYSELRDTNSTSTTFLVFFFHPTF